MIQNQNDTVAKGDLFVIARGKKLHSNPYAVFKQNSYSNNDEDDSDGVFDREFDGCVFECLEEENGMLASMCVFDQHGRNSGFPFSFVRCDIRTITVSRGYLNNLKKILADKQEELNKNPTILGTTPFKRY